MCITMNGIFVVWASGDHTSKVFVWNIFLSSIRIIKCLKIFNDFKVLFLIPVIENHLNRLALGLWIAINLNLKMIVIYLGNEGL